MRGLRDAFQNRRIARVMIRRPDLRRPFPAGLKERLEGENILSLHRRAKYIVMRLQSAESVLLHLGMSGRLLIDRRPESAPALPHEHLVLLADNGARASLIDPRRFGSVDLLPTREEETHPLLAFLGVEPLSERFTPRLLAERLHGRRTPLKTALLDQRLIAGLGNIYVCEALFRAGLHPARSAGGLTFAEISALHGAIGAVLRDAIAAGGSSLRDYVRVDGTKGEFSALHQVYGREGEACPRCPQGRCPGIRRITQAGRSTFYCPTAQRALDEEVASA